MSFILLGILNAQAAGGGAGGAYELIESQVLASSASSVTFSSIPQDFKHLQIRSVARGSTGNALTIYSYLNGDTASNYSFHRLRGDGSSVSSAGAGSTVPVIASITAEATTTLFGTFVVDYADYASTSKNTTMRSLSGWYRSSAGRIELNSGAWYNTNAVSSITLTISSDAFQAGSRFSLYGLRGE